MVLLLRPEELRGLIGVEEAIAAVEEGFRGWGQDPEVNAPRRRIHTPSGARVSVHQGAVPSLGATGLMSHCELVRVGAQTQEYHGGGHSVYVLYDAERGDLMAILIGEVAAAGMPTGANALRTAATSAVGTKHLARSDATKLGIYGTGRQARNHLLAFAAIRPLKSVKVYSRDPEHRRSFCAEMSPRLSLEVRPVERPREVARDVDILLTATNSNAPVFDGSWLEPGVHVTSIVGSNVGLVRGGFIATKRRELDNTTIGRCDVIVVSSRDQVIQDEQGDLFDPVQEGIIRWEDAQDLSDLLAGRTQGRTSPEQITLFKNNAGQGVADVAIAARAYQVARERGLGLELPIGRL